jgi:hypothetical protein
MPTVSAGAGSTLRKKNQPRNQPDLTQLGTGAAYSARRIPFQAFYDRLNECCAWGGLRMATADEFSFVIKFVRGKGDPRRVFEAASLLIEGFEELDDTIAQSVDVNIRTTTVLHDVTTGSLRVILKTLLENIDDQGLKEGEWKKAIGPALVKGKHLAIEALNRSERDAPKAIEDLRGQLDEIVSETDVKLLPAYAPIHEGKLISSLDKIQDAKRSLEPRDELIIETDGKIYEVDLTKTWEPADIVPVSGTSEKTSEGTVILTIRKPDLLGSSRWQFAHGAALVYASIEDEKWLKRFHDGKVALHSGDALRCKVRFTYIFDDTGKMIEQKTTITKVMNVIRGPGHQSTMFEDG